MLWSELPGWGAHQPDMNPRACQQLCDPGSAAQPLWASLRNSQDPAKARGLTLQGYHYALTAAALTPGPALYQVQV